MSWESTRKSIKESSNGKFLKLAADGDRAVIAIVGEPTERRLVWKDRKAFEPDSPEGKVLLAQGEKIKVRYELAILDLASGERKLLDANRDTIQAIDNALGKFSQDDWAFELKRRGAAGDPKMSISCLPDRKLTAEEIALIGAPPDIPRPEKPHEAPREGEGAHALRWSC